MLHRCGTSVSSCSHLGTSKDTGQDDPDCCNCTVCLSDIETESGPKTHELIFTLQYACYIKTIVLLLIISINMNPFAAYSSQKPSSTLTFLHLADTNKWGILTFFPNELKNIVCNALFLCRTICFSECLIYN